MTWLEHYQEKKKQRYQFLIILALDAATQLSSIVLTDKVNYKFVYDLHEGFMTILSYVKQLFYRNRGFQDCSRRRDSRWNQVPASLSELFPSY